MDRTLIATLILALGASPLIAADAPSAAPAASAAKPAGKPKASAGTAPLKTEDEKTFYSYGYRMGASLAGSMSASDAEAKAIAAGLRDAITGKPEAASLEIYLPKFNDLATKRVAAKAEATKAKGRAFAEAFSKEDGVKPIPMGGFIKTLTEGSGPAPKADDTVKVNYKGTLIDGTEFDSSYKRGQPAVFPLNGVIPCWSNGVAMMKVGGKSKLVCPSDVAYGDQGNPRGGIAGGSTLTFEVELLEIVKPEAPKDAAPVKPAKK